MQEKLLIKNPEQILKNHPKAAKKMSDWLTSQSGDVEFNTTYTEAILGLAPRILYDFFDEEGIHIYIQPFDAAGDILYSANILGQEDNIADYTSREEAEEAAFIKAIEILENAEN